MKRIFILVVSAIYFGSCTANKALVEVPVEGNGPLVCPTNYVMVPADTTLGTTEFCVSQYEMKAKTNAGVEVPDGNNNGGAAYDVTLYVPDARAAGTPWTQITLPETITECAGLGTGYKLISLSQWNALARNIESVGANWSSGTVGTGSLYKGHTDGVISGTAVADGYAYGSSLALAAGTDGYTGTGNTSGDAIGAGGEQKRTHILSNGSIVWDIAGNVRDRVDIDGQGGTISYTGPGSSGYYDMLASEISSTVSTIVSSTGGSVNLNQIIGAQANSIFANGGGRFYLSSGARTNRVITRGGNYSPGNTGGIFGGDMDGAIGGGTTCGFRCVYRP